jgi:hypothetical protein
VGGVAGLEVEGEGIEVWTVGIGEEQTEGLDGLEEAFEEVFMEMLSLVIRAEGDRLTPALATVRD